MLLKISDSWFSAVIFNQRTKSCIAHNNLTKVENKSSKSLINMNTYKTYGQVVVSETCSGLMPHSMHVVFSKWSLAICILSSVIYPEILITSILSSRGSGIISTTFAVHTNKTCMELVYNIRQNTEHCISKKNII